jgi:hypothetical protein
LSADAVVRHCININVVTLIGRVHDRRTIIVFVINFLSLVLDIFSLTNVIEINGFGIIIVDSI